MQSENVISSAIGQMILAVPDGLEPSIVTFREWCADQLRYGTIYFIRVVEIVALIQNWLSQKDSNPHVRTQNPAY